jgi:hypothetical protein
MERRGLAGRNFWPAMGRVAVVGTHYTVPEPTTGTLLIFALGFGLIAFGLKKI